jgi:Predicted membrane protein (DUF2207)
MKTGLRRAILLTLALLLPVLLGFAAGAARAAEYIDSYRSEIDLARDGQVTVTEIITVNAEGRDIRRGIFRDFPLYMVDGDGRRQKVGFEVLSVLRDGEEEAWHTEAVTGGMRVYMGSAETLLDPGRHTYELTYRTDRQIRFFEDHDEFYWNVTGNGWLFRIREATAVVTLPDGVRATDTGFFTGAQGSTARDARRFGGMTSPGFVTTRPLGAGEGLTIVIAMPKGSIQPPSADQARDYFLRDNINLIIGGIGLVLVTLYYVWFWRRVGRDPARGVVVPRWDPPDGLSPALVNYVDNKGFSGAGWEALSASLIDLAVKGYVILDDLKSGITVRRTGKTAAKLPTGQAALLSELGGEGDELIIDKDNGERVQKVAAAFRSSIEKEHRGKYYKGNIGPIIGGVALSIAVILVLLGFGDFDPDLAGFLIGPVFFGVFFGSMAVRFGKRASSGRSLAGRIFSIIVLAFIGLVGLTVLGGLAVALVAEAFDNGQWPVFAALAGIVLVNAVFFFLMDAPTPLGAKLMDGVEGLRLYLTVAETDRMNMAGAPAMSPQHFEKLLPYAVALGVEKPWSETFETWLAQAVSAAEAGAYQPGWYHGGSIGNFGGAIGGFSSSMASTIASTIPAPKTSSSSSGFSSGGGFSGGGGGGGGGGGW